MNTDTLYRKVTTLLGNEGCFISDETAEVIDQAVAMAVGDPRTDLESVPSHWDEDPEYPVVDWKSEVENDNTRQGYHDWVRHEREFDQD